MAATVVAISLLVAKVWHYWLSIALLAPFVLLIVGMGLLYVFKVVAAKHPRQ